MRKNENKFLLPPDGLMAVLRIFFGLEKVMTYECQKYPPEGQNKPVLKKISQEIEFLVQRKKEKDEHQTTSTKDADVR